MDRCMGRLQRARRERREEKIGGQCGVGGVRKNHVPCLEYIGTGRNAFH